jgi:hypothetical protein
MKKPALIHLILEQSRFLRPVSNPDISYLLSRFSLTPGFSPVEKGQDDQSRFNGFPQRVKAAEAVPSSWRPQTPG